MLAQRGAPLLGSAGAVRIDTMKGPTAVSHKFPDRLLLHFGILIEGDDVTLPRLVSSGNP